MVPVVEFEAARPQLTAVAFRLLGSVHDAEDAVQTTWIKASTADAADVRNPAAWLTTVLTRVCLDQLRARHRRREEPLLADMIPAEELAADEHYLRRENVSRALLVVLDRLTPPQRVAYVLHDLFDVPFREVARTLDTTSDNAKKHASRARRRIEQTTPAFDTTVDSAVVDAFLAAAAGGDIDRMLALMTDDCVRTADPALIPAGTPSVVTGARPVAEETRLFADRIRAATPMVVAGRQTHVIAPGGHVFAVLDITTRNGLVSRIAIGRAGARTPVSMP
ncbi:sigma-70 family RNA polymerase sigma factor [Nocardia miyunensis]|uniref:sigma-70 family RNA polymerase sigma factor n=1 Tax=Nocardia miyunensis TaxID=282684 RepID=UPI000A65B6AE|nr:sigma-70 family RNA polymerase sigma factor [Nocardia miyunensis]